MADVQDHEAATIATLRAELDEARRQLAKARDRAEVLCHQLDRAEQERDAALAALAFERTRLAALLEHAPAFIAVVRGPTYVFEFANAAFREEAGRDDLVGKSMVEAFPALAGHGFVANLDRVLCTGQPFIARRLARTIATRPTSDAAQRYANVVYQPIIDADGTTAGVLLHGVDVTEETATEQRIR